MDERINNELIKIQDELTALDNAVKQVEKAESVASSVIKTITELQGKYSNHLDFIQRQMDGFITQSATAAQNIIKDLSDKYTNQLQEVSGIFEGYHKETVLTQSQNNDLIRRTLDKTDSQIYQISASHNKQIEEVQSLLHNYLELAQSTAKLTDEVQKINFPKRLGNLENAAMQLNQVQVQLKSDMETVESKSEEIKRYTSKINKKSTITMIFVIVIFVIVAALGIDALLQYFPQMFDFLK